MCGLWGVYNLWVPAGSVGLEAEPEQLALVDGANDCFHLVFPLVVLLQLSLCVSCFLSLPFKKLRVNLSYRISQPRTFSAVGSLQSFYLAFVLFHHGIFFFKVILRNTFI